MDITVTCLYVSVGGKVYVFTPFKRYVYTDLKVGLILFHDKTKYIQKGMRKLAKYKTR